MSSTAATAAPEHTSPLGPRATIFVASYLALFLELALIRWVSCEIRVFAYCKNLVLIACFLGFGIGCLHARRSIDWLRSMSLLLLLALLVRLPWRSLELYGPRRVSTILAELSGFMIFHHVDAMITAALPLQLAFAVGWTVLLFFVIALILIPFGQATGAGIARFPVAVRAYSINIAGSLAGILTYTLVTYLGLPPLVWFVPVVLATLTLATDRRQAQALVPVAAALLLVLLPNDSATRQELWTAYQKITLEDGYAINVNNVGYQYMRPMPVVKPGAAVVDRHTIPYLLRPAARVLIVGAGSGNDAAAALNARASSVTAVEIDPDIYRIGLAHHPQAPYSDPRVEVVIDDARHYLKTSRRQFDVIVFSHLDSHTQLSSFTSVRLDDYIYTVEAFREARARLAPGGILYVSFFSELPFIGARLGRNLALAFDHPPVSLEQTEVSQSTRPYRLLYFLQGERDVMPELLAATRPWQLMLPAVTATASTGPSTDDWPFLSLERRRIPPAILLISAAILVVCVLFAWKERPAREAIDGRAFFLGAAFLLLEVHNVTRLALAFGTTWRVNAWVIGSILILILVANAVVERLRAAGRRGGAWPAIGLFVTLAAAWAVPLDLLLGQAAGTGAVLATLLLTAPIFFAALVFAEAFAASPAPSFSLGWNALGAITGGLCENLAYILGVKALVLIAALFYALALLSGRRPAAHLSPAGDL